MTPLLRIVIIFLSSLHVGLLSDASCESCEVRSFGKNPDTCICDHGAFCNEQTKKCEWCGKCFDTWDHVINGTKNDLLLFLKKLMDNSDTHETEHMLRTLSEKIRQNKHAWSEAKSLIETFESLLAQTADEINDLDRELGDRKKILETLEPIVGGEIELSTINDMADRIKSLAKNYSTTGTPENLNISINDLVLKYQQVKKFLDDFNETYPQLAVDPLGLAYSLQSDIDLVDSLFTKFKPVVNTNLTHFNDSLNSIYSESEKLIADLEEFLEDYLNVLVRIEELENRAKAVILDMKDIEQKLKHALKKEEKFWETYRLLKEEIDYFKQIKNLQDRLAKVNIDIEVLGNSSKELQEMMNDTQQELDTAKKKFAYEQLRFQNEKLKIESNMKRLEEASPKLDFLLEDLERVNKEIEGFGGCACSEELGQDIDDMLAKIEIYTSKIREYCLPIDGRLKKPVP